MLLFGCTFFDNKSSNNKVSVPGDTVNNTPEKINVNIQSQKSQSSGSNKNQPVSNGNENVQTDTQIVQKTKLQYSYDAKTPFSIYFISVGGVDNQGDSILIRKGDLTVLIDGGPEINAGNTINFLKSKGVGTINILISTTADPDHYGALSQVVDNFDVQEFWYTGSNYGDGTYQKLIDKVDQKGITQRIVSRGENYDLNGLNALILNPEQVNFNDPSNSAIAIKLTQNNFCALLTSDILFGAQAEVVNKFDTKCNILQIPYHGLGKGTAQIDFLLLKVMPKDAIISGGINDPTPGGVGSRYSVLEKLKAKAIKVYENYVGGIVKITSDGISYVISYNN